MRKLLLLLSIILFSLFSLQAQHAVNLQLFTDGGTSMCLGTSMNLWAVSDSAGGTYAWSQGDLPAPVADSVINISPNATGTYEYHINWVRDTFFGTDSITILVLDSVSHINPVSITPDHCSQSIGTAFITVFGGTGPYTYTFSGGGQFTTDTMNINFVNLAGDANYNVIVTDANGCQTITNNFYIPDEPPPSIPSVNIDSICPENSDGQITVNMPPNNGPFTYIWSHDTTGSNSVDSLAAGNYDLTVINAFGCRDSTTFTVPVYAGQQLSLPKDTTILPDQFVIIEPTLPSSAFGLFWIPDYRFRDFGENGIEAFPDSTITYTLTGFYADNCRMQDSITITIDRPILATCDSINKLVPDVFTPNDDGVNDFWYFQHPDIDAFEIHIYDRWGNKVYQSFDMNDKWSGKKRPGTKQAFRSSFGNVASDVYKYVLKYQIRGREEFCEHSGTITLLR